MQRATKCGNCDKTLTSQEMKEYVCNYCNAARCTKCNSFWDRYYTFHHCKICEETYCQTGCYFFQNERECEGRDKPCRCSLLDTLPTELRDRISAYEKSVSEIATTSYTKEEITWLLNIRKEVVSMQVESSRTEMYYWTPPLADRYQPLDIFLARMVVQDYTSLPSSPIYVGDRTYSRDETISKLCGALPPGSNYNSEEPNTVTLLDFKSVYMILHRRFKAMGELIAGEYAKKCALRYLNQVDMESTESEEYMFLSMVNMELEYDMTKDVCYMSLIEDALEKM